MIVYALAALVKSFGLNNLYDLCQIIALTRLGRLCNVTRRMSTVLTNVAASLVIS